MGLGVVAVTKSCGLVVECTPVSSFNTVFFHDACRAIVQAALGQNRIVWTCGGICELELQETQNRVEY
jgi:hypothetical protein